MTDAKEKKKTWERRLDDAKSKHRPKLKNWSKDNFSFSNKINPLGRYEDFTHIRQKQSNIVDINKPNEMKDNNVYSQQTIDRISCLNLTYDEFVNNYEIPSIPCIIKDIPKYENWNAHNTWKFQNKALLRKHLGSRYFKVGEDDEGYKVKVRMKYFLKYLNSNQDDSPLYIFDGNYDNDMISKSLLNDYKIPSYFPDDYFSLVGESRRPPYRWFLIGPERSGSCIHIDPLGTSAWNTVLVGRKRWVLMPPGVSKSIVKGLDVIKKGEDDEAINFFVDILPRIHEKYGHSMNIIEFTQEPGDTVFVPGGWWHAVLNIEDTIAITQNFCSRHNFDQVWLKTRIGRRKMSCKWLKLLHDLIPNIATRAEIMNQNDNFIMGYKYSKKDKIKFNRLICENSNNSYRTISDKNNSNENEVHEITRKRLYQLDIKDNNDDCNSSNCNQSTNKKIKITHNFHDKQ